MCEYLAPQVHCTFRWCTALIPPHCRHFMNITNPYEYMLEGAKPVLNEVRFLRFY